MIAVPRVLRTPDSADFFDYARLGKLLLRRCDSCGAVRGPQERFCPRCHAAAHTMTHAQGSASLVSWAVVHRSPLPALEEQTPFTTGIVELAEGPWLLVRVLTAPGEALRAGMELEIWIAAAGDGEGEPLVLAQTKQVSRAGHRRARSGGERAISGCRRRSS
jgi:uncharacterized protein